MKRLNKAGFTLIELLAVITIMGILMMVAIPSVSRTIENSRRDTFADNALTYVNTVRNSVMADEVECCTATGCTATSTGDKTTVSATPNGTYYFAIDTTAQATKDIMEKVATSSWGGAKLTGYVQWTKSTDATTKRTTTTYSVCLEDSGDHGFSGMALESSVSRSKILTSGADCTSSGKTATGYVCILK